VGNGRVVGRAREIARKSVGCLCGTFACEDGVYLCYSYLIMNAISSYPAVGGRGSGASARRFPLAWTARTDTTRRAKAGIESFPLSKFARELVKMPYYKSVGVNM
jgi:hypothetical protein